jgi:hypothetical protein
VAHDTQEQHWQAYRYADRMFVHRDYTITHDDKPHRTTLWKLRR